MKRILSITNHYPTDAAPGNSPCIQREHHALRRLGYQVEVLFIDGERSKLNYLKAMWDVFWRAQIKGQFDLIHAYYGYCGVVARMQTRRPVIVTFRGSDVLSWRERPLSWLVARCVSRVIVRTEEMRRVLGLPAAHIIACGVDMDVFKPADRAAARRALGLPAAAPLVLFPYDPQRPMKRYDLVEAAAALLKSEFPDLQILSIYDKSHETVAQYMNACDALVMASDYEGAPAAVREAMACNLPVVSVDVGDVAAIIQDTEGCYVCERTAADIAAHLRKVLHERRRTTGRQRMAELDVSKTAGSLVGIYQELLFTGKFEYEHNA